MISVPFRSRSIKTLNHSLLIPPTNIPRPVPLSQPKDTLHHTQLSGSGIHSGDRQPVINNHARPDDRGAAIDTTGDERDLEQTAQLVLVLDGGLGMDEAALVGQGHVGARQDVGGDGLAEDLDAQRVGDDLFGLALQVWVDEGDVVVGADDVAEGGEPFFDSLDGDGGGEGVADVGEFLVGGGGGEEEAFAVSGWGLGRGFGGWNGIACEGGREGGKAGRRWAMVFLRGVNTRLSVFRLSSFQQSWHDIWVSRLVARLQRRCRSFPRRRSRRGHRSL